MPIGNQSPRPPINGLFYRVVWFDGRSQGQGMKPNFLKSLAKLYRTLSNSTELYPNTRHWNIFFIIFFLIFFVCSF